MNGSDVGHCRPPRHSRRPARGTSRAPIDAGDDVGAVVAEIISAVPARGDAALRELTARFDGCELEELRVPPSDLAAALAQLTPALRSALELARDQIVAWHEAQREKEARHERLGIEVHERVIPVDRAGCYVPGGRAPLVSSVLMTALPARVAGVPEVVLCVPPGPDGRVTTAILAAAELASVDEVYRVGGAQAIAAMAYGTETIRPVDVIVGPGNAYVVEAKRQVFGAVGIDGLAGPSEVAIVADDTVDPAWVAADLLAQAEHGPGGAVAVIVWDEAVAERVELALETLLLTATRRDEAEATLTAGGRIVLVDDAPRAIDAANAIAPEHLELMCADAAVARAAGAQRGRGVRRRRTPPRSSATTSRARTTSCRPAARLASRARCASPTSRSTSTSCTLTRTRCRVSPTRRGSSPRQRACRPTRTRSASGRSLRDGRTCVAAVAGVAARAARRPAGPRGLPLAAGRRRRAAQHQREPLSAAAGVRGRWLDALRDVDWHRYPDRGATELRAGSGRFLGQPRSGCCAATAATRCCRRCCSRTAVPAGAR